MFKLPPLHSLCLGFHIFFVVIYLALLIVWAWRVEYRIVFDTKQGNNVSTILSSILQVYITVYCATLLFFAQNVSTRQNLLRRQPLTVTHDISAAWSGLGSAVFSLYNQFSVAASIGGVSGVAAYLTCISILHIATPTLFSLQLFNANSSILVPTTLAFPNATANDFIVASTTTGFGSEMSLLSRLQSSTPGLMGSTIFDVLEVSSVIGNASVVATTFDVNCGSVQGQLLPVSQVNRTKTLTDIKAPTYFVDQTGNALVSIGDVAGPYTLNTSGSLLGYPGHQILLTSTYNFSDSQGVVESVFPLPSALKMIDHESNMTYDIDLLQVIGCSLSVSSHTAVVDVQSGNLIEVFEQANRSSRWIPFVLEDLDGIESNFYDAWPWMFHASPGMEAGPLAHWCTAEGDCNSRAVFSALDSTIMRLLGLPPFGGPCLPYREVPIPQNLTLEMLEDAISNTTALIFWFFTRYTGSDPVDLASRHPNSSYLSSWEVDVYRDTPMFRLSLNWFQLWVSTLMALILLFLAIILTNGSGGATLVDDVGFLQTLWLSHQNPDLTRFVSEIDKPSTAELRRRGMTTAVRFATQVWEDSTESTGLVLRQFSNDSESHIQSLSPSRTDSPLNSQDFHIYRPTMPATARPNETSAT